MTRVIASFFLAAGLLALISFTVIETKPRIFLIGDSTLANKKPEAAPETGWGMVFPTYIDADVLNYAVNGRSTRSFRTLGHWKTVVDQLRKDDWVFIQFGHNDAKESDTARYAAAQTDYRTNLIRYITEIRATGARPLLITPVMRRKFDENGKFVDQHGEYPGVVRDVAAKLTVPLIDLHRLSEAVLVAQGPADSKQLFLNLEKNTWPNYPEGKDDNTHFTPYGAAQMASLVANSIRTQNLPLAQYLIRLPAGDRYVYELPQVMPVAFRKDTLNIIRYGATPGALTLATKFIQEAIDACSAGGGGTVLIPKGLWITGPLVLKNNVNLHVAENTILQFSDDPNDYPLVKTNWEGLDAIRAQSPLSANGAENIGVTGKGIIDGAGQVWRPVKKNKITPAEWGMLIKSGGVLNDANDTWYPTARALKGSQEKFPGVLSAGYDVAKAELIKEFLRPNMVSLVNCKRVLLEGVTFQNSPAWCLHPLLTQHLTLRNLTVRNPWNAQNGDGVDLESCRYVRVENSTFDVGDDGICIKSGRDEEGRKRGVATEDVIIKNCTVFHGHGGFVIGSEMSGGARNIYVSDCNFSGTDVGLRFKTARGRGGVVEKIYVNAIRMTNMGGTAILFDMYYMAKDPLLAGDDKTTATLQPVTEATPQFKDFYITDVICKGAETGIFIRGLPEMNIKDIELKNITLQSKKGFSCTEANQIHLKNVTLFCDDNRVMRINNSKNIILDSIGYKATTLLLDITGSTTKNIRLLNTPELQHDKSIVFGEGAAKEVLTRK